MSWRDRIAEFLTLHAPNQQWVQPPVQSPAPVQPLSNEDTLARRGIYLDDFRAPGDAPYREDRPGMDQRLARRLQQPFVGPEIDPRLAPPPAAMLGITPTNDPNAVSPDMVPWELNTSLYGRRA